MKINYWVYKLKVSTLWKILRRSRSDENHVVERLTYIEAGKAVPWVLKLLQKRGKIEFQVHKIQPRDSIAGPVLQLHGIRDDNGRLLIMRIYRHVLDIRRRIVTRLMERFISYPFFKDKKPMNHITAYLGLKVAEKINHIVYLAFYARWKYHEPGNRGKVENIMVIPHLDWDDIMKESFHELVDKVEVETHRKETLDKLFITAKALIKSLALVCVNPFSGKENESGTRDAGASLAGCKIMTYYAMGVERGQRSDIGFLHDANLSPSRLVLYSRYPTMTPTEKEKEWLTANGVGCFAAPEVAKADSYITPWRPSPLYKNEITRFYRLYLKTAKDIMKRREKNGLWMLATLWEMGKLTAYWKDFLLSHRIGIVVNSIPALENFIPNMAVSEIGGLSVNIERSILFDYCTYIHNSPSHLSFVTGPYSLKQITEPSLSLNTLQVGSLNTEDSRDIPGIERLRENSKIVIALFDELPNDVFFGDSIRQFYQAFIDLAGGDPRFSLLIKTKKPQVLEALPPEIKHGLQRLANEVRCMQADWKVTALTAAAQSDIVACVPSTAAFESVLAGTRTILYNPMATGSSLFYTNNGLNRRVFEDSKSMGLLRYEGKRRPV
jgi:hypothetical protein